MCRHLRRKHQEIRALQRGTANVPGALHTIIPGLGGAQRSLQYRTLFVRGGVGSLPKALRSLPKSGGNLPKPRGDLPTLNDNLPKVRGSLPK